MMKKWLALSLLCLALNANAIVDVKTAKTPVQKQHLGKITQFKGQLKGYQTVDHRFQVKKGQRLKIRLLSKNRFAYFSLYEPKNDEAIFTGAISGDQFKGVAKKSGEYRLRTYLVRAAARRNEVAKYRVDIIQN
ncbi:MAG: hypothetical protein Q4A60_00920 [Pasteurellaceae bacterium]|nr:hypothetical protein [Pasteurellaceae bacterium]